MARRTYARGARRTRRTPRSTYRATAPRKSYRSRAPTRRPAARRGSSSARTIRIEIVQPSQSAVARPEIGMKVAPAKRKATM